ncbi:unnamed protein product [Prorocentrum cordatum]|uniref:Uncharacterized protein n=1 Tax=Prorocentrum cordatum TaxID=2364126 RepID=A0ABN9XJN7_9DINO|nr:unnamed protein product [Polarella glacialis]
MAPTDLVAEHRSRSPRRQAANAEQQAAQAEQITLPSAALRAALDVCKLADVKMTEATDALEKALQCNGKWSDSLVQALNTNQQLGKALEALTTALEENAKLKETVQELTGRVEALEGKKKFDLLEANSSKDDDKDGKGGGTPKDDGSKTGDDSKGDGAPKDDGSKTGGGDTAGTGDLYGLGSDEGPRQHSSLKQDGNTYEGKDNGTYAGKDGSTYECKDNGTYGTNEGKDESPHADSTGDGSEQQDDVDPDRYLISSIKNGHEFFEREAREAEEWRKRTFATCAKCGLYQVVATFACVGCCWPVFVI